MVDMFKVIFGKKARQDLQEISSYHLKVASPQVAKKIRKGIIDSAKKLQTFPHRKPILAGTEDRSSPVRYTKKWSFKILFSNFEAQPRPSFLESGIFV